LAWAGPRVQILIEAVDRASSVLRGVGDSARGLSDRFSSVGRFVSRAGLALTGFGAATVGALGLSVKSAADFESQMVEAGKVIEGFEEHRAELEELAKTMSVDWALSTGEVAEAMAVLGSMGQDATQIMQNLNDIIKMGVALDIRAADAARLVASAQAIFKDEALSTTQIADKLNAITNETAATVDFLAEALKMGGPAAAATGASMDELLGILVPLAEAGFQGSMAGRALNTILPALSSNADKLTSYLQSLKAQGFDVNIQAMEGFREASPLEQLVKLAEATKNLNDEQKRQIATMIGGRQFFKQMLVLLNNIEDAEEGVRIATNSAGSAQEEAAKTTETLAFKFRQLKQELAIMAVDLGSQLIPVLKELLEAIKPHIPEFAELAKVAAQSLVPALIQLIPVITGLLNAFNRLPMPVKKAMATFTLMAGVASAGLGPALMGVGRTIPLLVGKLGVLSGGFSSVASLISGTVIPLLTNPLTLAIAGVALAVGGLYLAWTQNWFGIRDKLSEAWASISMKFASIKEWLMETLRAALDKAYRDWRKAWELVGDALKYAWRNIIKPVFDKIAWTIGQLKGAVQGLIDLISSIELPDFSGFFSSVNTGVKQAGETVSGTIRKVGNLIYDTVNGVTYVFDELGAEWGVASKEIADELVGHSVWPDMMRRMVWWTEWGVDRTLEAFGRLGAVTGDGGLPTAGGARIINISGPLVEVHGASVSEEELARRLVWELRRLVS